MDKVEPMVYLNDAFVPASKAKINIFDEGLLSGASLTDMTRTFGHRPFRLQEHLDRLYRSCKYASIEIPLTAGQLLDHTHKLIDANCQLLDTHQDLGIVHFVTTGENPQYSLTGSVRSSPTIGIHSCPLPLPAGRHLFSDGAHVVTPSIRHVPPQCLDPKAKYRSRLHMWLADQQAKAVDPRATALLLDIDGNLAECVGSNFVMLVGTTIYSPTDRNRLEGVSLVTVRELAGTLGLDWVEKDLQLYDAVNADEAWLTSTPWCMAPCTKINKIPIGRGAPGPTFHRIIQAWSDVVGIDVLKQNLNTSIESAKAK